MGILVQKFGGTSVANPECIENAAEKVIKAKQLGHDLVVVVSAMSGETDRLINLAKRMQPRPDAREYSAVVATGEQITMALMTMALLQRNCPAKSLAGHQVKIRTEGAYDYARIKHIDTDRILAELKKGNIVVVAGFQGVDENNDITTLGRGGSDTTAVALAAALNAVECQIFTDVDGVYTADPRIVPDAKRVDKVTFAEMMELASLGAKVLQHRAVEFAGKYNVPLRVLSTFEEGPGTLITLNEASMEQVIISGITCSKNEAKITLKGLPTTSDVTYKILEPLGAADIGVDMIMQNGHENGMREFSFTVSKEQLAKVQVILPKLKEKLPIEEVQINETIAKLSIVGIGLKSHSAVASKIFQLLAECGIRIYNIVTSEIKISVLIDEKYLEQSVRVLHEGFNLGKVTEAGLTK